MRIVTTNRFADREVRTSPQHASGAAPRYTSIRHRCRSLRKEKAKPKRWQHLAVKVAVVSFSVPGAGDVRATHMCRIRTARRSLQGRNICTSNHLRGVSRTRASELISRHLAWRGACSRMHSRTQLRRARTGRKTTLSQRDERIHALEARVWTWKHSARRSRTFTDLVLSGPGPTPTSRS